MQMVSPSRAKVVQVTLSTIMKYSVPSLEFFIVRLSHYVYHIFLSTSPEYSELASKRNWKSKVHHL